MTTRKSPRKVSREVWKTAQIQRVRPDHISFIDALRWPRPPRPSERLPELLVNPQRPGRREPRCIKRRGKQYPLMRCPRDELRKRLRKQHDAA